MVAQLVKNLPVMRETQVQSLNPWVGKIPWRRKWQPTPVFLPGESHGQRSLVGYNPWGCKESDTTEQLTHTVEAYHIFESLLPFFQKFKTQQSNIYSCTRYKIEPEYSTSYVFTLLSCLTTDTHKHFG